ncbi:MAG: tRNA 2-thiouridine(34) synthase MnmA [Eubacterium sp.]|nr:tRNA 2-thiouridine(34) synthase MnmA [Eubacterium sp.]
MTKKALIAMSGGVDSSVAAYIIREQGYECMGATMRLFDNEDAGLTTEKSCCSLDDSQDAWRVARDLGFPHYTLNFKDVFRRCVIDRFVRAYEHGDTPNPCIDCNRFLKFQALYERGQALGCQYIVTGHYARIEEVEGRYRLKKALDPAKDQSYVLYTLTQAQLAHTLFPLGGLQKSEVRKIAEEQGFVNAQKKESQDICFVPDGKYAEAIRRFTGKEYPCGSFVDREGHVLGEHKGIIRYTIGQRKGLGLALPAPAYVLEKDVAGNRVILGPNEALFGREVVAGDVNWIAWDEPPKEFRACARIRYNQKEQPATVWRTEEGFRLQFDEPQRAVTPGQAVVLYDGEDVLGGGTII